MSQNNNNEPQKENLEGNGADGKGGIPLAEIPN